MPGNDPIQFRSQELGEAVDVLKDLRVEGINVSELGREGLRRMIQDVTTGDEKAAVYSAYQRGEIDADVARVFLGEHFETMQDDAEEIRASINDDTSDLVQ